MTDAPTSTPESPSPSQWAITHAKQVDDLPSADVPDGHVLVELLTDPWSVWCWGFEPARRALETRFPTIRFRPRVGGMFPQMPDPAQSGFNVRRFFGVVQRTTGMPLRLDATSGDRPTSTYPACVHVFAVRLIAPDKERAFLRALREAAYLDARNVSRLDVAADVAASVGVSRGEFEEAMATGEPARDHAGALAALHAQNLHGYPTFLVRTRARTVRVEGFQSLPAILSIAEAVTGREHVPGPAPAVEDVVPVGERVATREVAEVLGVSVERAFEELTAVAEDGVLVRERQDTGDTWRRAP